MIMTLSHRVGDRRPFSVQCRISFDGWQGGTRPGPIGFGRRIDAPIGRVDDRHRAKGCRIGFGRSVDDRGEIGFGRRGLHELSEAGAELAFESSLVVEEGHVTGLGGKGDQLGGLGSVERVDGEGGPESMEVV
jgi:hypothetical protein